MTALLDLQTALQQHLLGAPSDIAAAAVPGRGVDAAARLQVYHHAYRARLAAALADSFAQTAHYLGDEEFEAVALDYIEGHPSAHPSLRWYGSDFPAWLAARHRRAPECGELAALDAALRRAFDGLDAPVLGLVDLGAVAAEDWDGLRLVLHPTAERLSLRLNTLALWQALDAGQPPPPPRPLAAPMPLLVWRRGLQPHFRSLGTAEALALRSLAEGAPFGAMCEALAAACPDEDTAALAGGFLRRWIDDGLLSGLLHSTASRPAA